MNGENNPIPTNQNQNQNQQQIQQQQQLQHQQWLAMQQQYQQQWLAMQQQQIMMYNQHYVPYYHPQHHQLPLQHYQQQQPIINNNNNNTNNNVKIHNSSEENKTIWIGDLQQWMDDNYLQSCFSQAGEVISVKIIRNRLTGQSERYGFIEFDTHATADKVLQSYNGATMPNTEQPFRLNWASFSGGDRRPEAGSDSSIFVGDLAIDVTDDLLHETFASKYPSVKGAKVVIDANSGRSKGYGFVRFGDENERSRAMTEMNGAYCSSRPMRISIATPKKPSPQQHYASQAVILSGGYASNGFVPQSPSDNDLSNTTIFVGGIDSEVTDEDLRQSFTQFGEVISVKIPPGKGCGFVQFVNRSDAEDAMRLTGSVIGKNTVRLSWGRTFGNKQSRMDSNNQWNGRQGYNGYGYAAGAPYGASSNGHGNHEQSVN